MSKINTVFLDLDNTLVDFNGAVYDLFGFDRAAVGLQEPTEWHGIHKAISKVIGRDVTEAELWARVADAGEDWWANLEWLPGSPSLVRELQGLEYKLFVCSSTGWIPSGAAGKLRWVARNIGCETFLCRYKNMLAAPDRVLIDDAPHQVESFRKAGGHAIYYPQPWNDAVSEGWNKNCSRGQENWVLHQLGQLESKE